MLAAAPCKYTRLMDSPQHLSIFLWAFYKTSNPRFSKIKPQTRLVNCRAKLILCKFYDTLPIGVSPKIVSMSNPSSSSTTTKTQKVQKRQAYTLEDIEANKSIYD